MPTLDTSQPRPALRIRLTSGARQPRPQPRRRAHERLAITRRPTASRDLRIRRAGDASAARLVAYGRARRARTVGVGGACAAGAARGIADRLGRIRTRRVAGARDALVASGVAGARGLRAMLVREAFHADHAARVAMRARGATDALTGASVDMLDARLDAGGYGRHDGQHEEAEREHESTFGGGAATDGRSPARRSADGDPPTPCRSSRLTCV